MEKTTLATKSKIFRYKLSDEIMLDITQFAKIHQLDDRHMYKAAWAAWLINKQDEVEREVSRLQNLDYKGDIIDKMFKAGRYYFRGKEEEKPLVAAAAAPPPPPPIKNKRDYIIMDQVIIRAMDNHLRELINNNNFKPALAYDQFCEQHMELLRAEIRRLMAQNIPGEKMSAKFKKTYKNRYFILQKNN